MVSFPVVTCSKCYNNRKYSTRFACCNFLFCYITTVKFRVPMNLFSLIKVLIMVLMITFTMEVLKASFCFGVSGIFCSWDIFHSALLRITSFFMLFFWMTLWKKVSWHPGSAKFPLCMVLSCSELCVSTRFSFSTGSFLWNQFFKITNYFNYVFPD